MTTHLGEAVLVKTLTTLCDGQCGGEVTLVTDEVTAAYAVVETSGNTPYVGGDCDVVEKRRDGSIVVSCTALNGDDDTRYCDGDGVFTKADLNDAAWSAPTSDARYMQPMERQS